MQGVEILAERETGVYLSNVAVPLAIELSEDISTLAPAPGYKLTSLTGILDTPSLIAMNQQALGKMS